MTNDRNYLRMLSDSELIRLAVDSYNETSIVLAERLDGLLNVEEELEHLQTLYDHLVAENNALRDNAAE